MTAIMDDLTASALVAAIEANTQEAVARWAHGLGAEVQREPDLTWFASGLPLPLCNGVIHAAFSPSRADQRIAETLHHYQARGLPMCWLVGPSSRPSGLGVMLEAHGLLHAEEGPGMAIDLHMLGSGATPPVGLAIKDVDDGEALKTWIDILCIGSGFPGEVRDILYSLMDRHGLATMRGLGRHPSVRTFLGMLAGKPVATALLFLAAGVAGLYDVATVPEARRRGIGTALTLAALRTARELGYRVGILQSSAMGIDVYRRLGFQLYCSLSLYFWLPT